MTCFTRFRAGNRGVMALTALLAIMCLTGGCAPQSPLADTVFKPPWKAASPQAALDGSETPPQLPEERAFTFDDCVVYAARNSPELTNSAIQLETVRLQSDTAFWRQMPQVYTQFHVISNVTSNDPSSGGDTAYRLSFSVRDFQPVGNYFAHKAALLMKDMAYFTHQMAVEKMAGRIGELILRLDSMTAMRAHQEALLALARSAGEYQRTQGGSALEAARARLEEEQARTMLERNEIQQAALRQTLKQLLGFAPEWQLRLEPHLDGFLRAKDRLGAFTDADRESIWNASPGARLVQTAHRLQDYNIMLAWSRFLPDAGVDVFTANPYNAYAGNSSRDETYVGLRFSMPLMDWGERYRGVQQSRLQKAGAFQTMKQRRLEFLSQWMQAWQDAKLAEAEMRLAEQRLKLAGLDVKKAELEHASGVSDFSAVLAARKKSITEAAGLEDAALNLRLKEFACRMLGGAFRQRFFAPFAGHADGVTP